MASTAISAQGATVAINTGTEGSPTWTLINNLSTFSGLDGEASEIDVTNLSSTAKEFRIGLKDFGGFNVEYHVDYDDVGQNALRGAGNAVKEIQVTLPNAKTLTFDALIKNADSVSGGIDAVLTGSCSMKVTGDVVIA